MPRRSRRAVYDPTIENDQLMKTTLFRDDPLAACDLEDDIRQWNNASNNNNNNNTNSIRRMMTPSKRKWCYVVAATLTMILLVVTIGVTVRNKNSGSTTTTSSNGNNNAGNTPPVAAPSAAAAPSKDSNNMPLLDPPIATLSQLCSRDRVQQADKRSACQVECSKAACCALDCDTGANVAACQAYNKICEILIVTPVKEPDESTLDMPPSELNQVCALENLIELAGYQNCQTKCQVAACCHLPMSDPTSCNVPYHTECIAYHSICGILEHVSAPVDDTPKALEMPSEQLWSLCSKDVLQTVGGYAACHEACAPASCCTDADASQNCFSEYASVCAEYAEPCTALSHAVPPAPEDLPALCGMDQLQTVEGFEACEAICARASCCQTYEGMQATCADDAQCAEYQGPCSILETAIKPSSSETPVAANEGASAERMNPPPSYISEQCTTENIEASTQGRHRCADICAEADCCQYPSNLPELSCLAGNEDVCAEYYSYCSLLEENTNNGGEDIMENPSQWSNEYAGMDIYTACADLTTTEGLQLCHDVCTEALCCYTSGASTCLDDERCDDFDLCFKYKALSYIHEDIPDLIEKNCADLVSLEGLELCEASCEQAVCCFVDEMRNTVDDCEGQDLSYCPQYEACGALIDMVMDANNTDGEVDVDHGEYGGTVPDNEANSLREQIEQVCDEADMKYEKCLTLCDKGRCCWNSNESNCASGIDCSTYAACANLA